VAALSKLKWLVVAENFEQETAAFWRDDIQALIDKKPEDVQTEVFMLPAANFAEKDGSFVNSARWIQWKWKAVDPPGEAKPDQEIIARFFLKVRELYEREGGRVASRADPSFELVVLQRGATGARRSGEGDQRVGNRRGARRERQRGGARRPATGARRYSTRI
jgi:anaerobic selenocysteine-containing dehydrogenase